MHRRPAFFARVRRGRRSDELIWRTVPSGRLRALLDRRTLLVGLGMGLTGFGAYTTRTMGLTARLLTRKRHGACEMSETWRWCSRYNPQKEETGNDKISLW